MAGKARVAFVALALLGFSNVALAARTSAAAAEGFDPSTIKRVAFLSLTRVLSTGDGPWSICPLDQTSHEACPIGDAAEAELARALGQALLASAGPVTWIPQAEINAARAKTKTGDGALLSPAGPAQIAIGRELSADAVLFGFIYCYQDRSGTSWASARPAAVGFCLHLVDPSTQKILWTYSYRDRQRPLTENLLELGGFIKRKGKWITSEEMSREAAAAVVGDLPWTPAARKPKKRGARLGPGWVL